MKKEILSKSFLRNKVEELRYKGYTDNEITELMEFYIDGYVEGWNDSAQNITDKIDEI